MTNTIIGTVCNAGVSEHSLDSGYKYSHFTFLEFRKVHEDDWFLTDGGQVTLANGSNFGERWILTPVIKQPEVFEAEVTSNSTSPSVFYGKYSIVKSEYGRLAKCDDIFTQQYNMAECYYVDCMTAKFRQYDFATPAEYERFLRVKQAMEAPKKWVSKGGIEVEKIERSDIMYKVISTGERITINSNTRDTLFAPAPERPTILELAWEKSDGDAWYMRIVRQRDRGKKHTSVIFHSQNGWKITPSDDYPFLSKISMYLFILPASHAFNNNVLFVPTTAMKDEICQAVEELNKLDESPWKE